MRILLLIAFLANIVFAFGTLPWLPDQVAIHFDAAWQPDDFASPIEYAILMSATVFVVAGTNFLISLLMLVVSPAYFNVPNRNYWLNEENRPKTVRRVRGYIEMIGVGTMLFILFVQWELFRANQTVPPALPNSNMLMAATGILLAVIFFETVHLLWSFRLPKDLTIKEWDEK